jgi:Uma2 family endonuclease
VSNALTLHYTYEQYLQALEDSRIKLEFWAGVVYAMAGGTIAHGQLAAAAIHRIATSLPHCKVFSSDVKIRVDATDLAAFPDASVACGEVVRAKLDAHAVVNPAILVEVTSKSTEDYDRGDKLAQYKQLPSLRVVLFVSHRERRVTIVERDGGQWHERDVRSGENVVVREPPLSFSIDDLYAGVTLDSA